jgi:hypothetical protein
MKKIITGMLGIVATLALVGGVAYAVTFGHVEATASATTTNDLLIYNDATSSYTALTDLSGSAFADLSTVVKSKVLFFKNQTGAPTIALTAHQQGLLGGNLTGDKVLVGFVNGNTVTPPLPADFHSLNDWTTANGSTGYPIAGVVIPANTQDHPVTMFVKLDPSTPTNGGTSYSVTGINFDFGPTY